MRLIRLYLDLDLTPGVELDLPSAQARHAVQVLRLDRDAPLVLFNGDGYDYPARLIEVGRERARVLIESRGDPEPESRLDIHLALGISKGERMDFAIQKAVELGVTRITPLFTRRAQVRLDGARLDKRLEHWRGVVVSACEQSGRRRLPALEPALELETWLESPHTGGLLLDPLAERALPALSAPASGLTLLIGPEGGLDPREREAARCHGFQGVRLGPRILRTETAPLAAIAVIQALWGDFRQP
ncbi:16S rRNA (uracil(1498)-N(3))-methyltransferase [Allochromatium palmeri]|uniref:Ribosomal RNA small subunit methyltransferase E n=1 Tax=Allochromatium palmeri TaxID=231048 RepID=A0A6N8EDS9_9GAMM|nr:16S rRNA (uracil(1498)-N(3))-methyltransferase [Allochromatium palmeri]MTW22385.1 16S rRNA (uracil(1498)-N(3))-methyltransferase [Allochromatium palmeri]